MVSLSGLFFLFLKYLLIKINNQIREMSNFDAVRPISLIWISELGLIIAIDGFRIIHILSLHIPVMFTTNTLIIQWMFLHKNARMMVFTKKNTSNIVLISFSKSNLLFVMEKLCELCENWTVDYWKSLPRYVVYLYSYLP